MVSASSISQFSSFSFSYILTTSYILFSSSSWVFRIIKVFSSSSISWSLFSCFGNCFLCFMFYFLGLCTYSKALTSSSSIFTSSSTSSSSEYHFSFYLYSFSSSVSFVSMVMERDSSLPSLSPLSLNFPDPPFSFLTTSSSFVFDSW